MASALDYLAAGAKDFANDVKQVMSGTSKGPSFDNRAALIHPSFPTMGPEKRAHEGSQSTTPEKGNP